MKVYAIAFNEVDFGGCSVVINFPIFVRKEAADKFLVDQGLVDGNMWGSHFVQEMELVE